MEITDEYQFNHLIKSLTNEQIVLKLRANYNSKLFEELVERFHPLFNKYLHTYFIPNYDIDDFTQEGRITLLQAIESYEPEKYKYFAPYMKYVYRNRIFNILRLYTAQKREGMGQELSLEVSSKIGEEYESFETLTMIPDKYFIQPPSIIEIKESIDKYYKQLSPLEYEVLERYKTTHSIEMIAVEIDKPVTTVRNALVRCRLKYNDMLDELGYG